MSDPVKMTIALLKADGGVTSLVGSNIFGGVLPEHYDPTDNPAIVISVKGGSTHSELPEQTMSVQLTCWDGVNRFLAAREVYNSVFVALHGQSNLDFGDDGKLLNCIEETPGQDVIDPDSGWATVVSSFSLDMIRSQTGLAVVITQNQSTKAYVDSQDAITLAAAEAYTDSHVASEVTLRVNADVAVLVSAEAYTDAAISGLPTAPVTSVAGKTGVVTLVEGDVANLTSDLALKAAKTYVDTQDAATLTSAETYTDAAISLEASSRVTGDSTTLTSAEAYTDTSVATEATARSNADALKANLTTPTFVGPVIVKDDAIGSDGNAPVTGLFVKNTTAATGVLTAQQDPPSIEMDGNYWDGSASQPGGVTLITHFGTNASCNFTFLMKTAQAAGYSVLYKNNNAATSGQNCQVPNFSFVGSYWNGSAAAQETWQFVHVLGSGSNPTSIWKLLHSGTSGQCTFDMTNGVSPYKVLVTTVAVDTNDTQAASTAFVIGQLSASGDGTPAMSGTAARGTSIHGARADHVHPTDTSKQSTSEKDAASGYAGLDSDTLLKCSELPAWMIEGVNNSIVRGPVDGSGNPAYSSVATSAGVGTLTLLGGTTPIEMYIDGLYQKIADNTLQVALNNGTDGTHPAVNFIYVKKRTTSKQLTSSDIGVTTNAPVFGNNQTAPSTTLASSSNPVYWFDQTVNQWKKATSNGGSFTADPIVPVAVVVVDNAGALLGSGYWGPRWTPYKVMELCGQGTDGMLNVQTGTSTVEGFKQYSSFICSGGTYKQATAAGTVTVGVIIYSQAPIVVCGSGIITTVGTGPAGGAGTTLASGAGAAANASVTMGGAGGGGGGSTTAVGAIGGNIQGYYTTTGTVSGGAGGTTAPTNGTNGVNNSSPIPLFAISYFIGLSGSGGGGGAGDTASATTTGGAGGAGGGLILLRAPALTVASGSTVTSSGADGVTPATGTNGSGGGGGGGGFVLGWVGYYSNSGTVSAAGGTGGVKKGSGTGKAGGNGGVGKVQIQRVF